MYQDFACSLCKVVCRGTQDASRALARDLLSGKSHHFWEAVFHPIATLVLGVGFISGLVPGQPRKSDSSRNK